MTDDRAAMTERVEDIGTTLEDLRKIIEESEDLDLVLDRLTRMVVQAIPDADAVSVTLVSDTDARSVGATDESLVPIDHEQYESGKGPCVEAAERRQPVRVSIEQVRDRWPEFCAAADQVGMQAYLAVPLLLDDQQEIVGALNMYGREPQSFDRLDEALLMLFATAAAAAIATARRYHRARRLAENMASALVSRSDIDQAKGALMARHGLSAHEAFELLVRQSQRTNVKLREVARELLQTLVTTPSPATMRNWDKTDG